MSLATRQLTSSTGPSSVSSLSPSGGDRHNRVQALAFSLASLQKAPAIPKPNNENNREDDDGMLTPAKRLERCRERNREHARRTRIRKKVQLEALQKKRKNLQDEQAKLKQVLEDRRVASILLNLSGNADPTQLQQELPHLDDESVTSFQHEVTGDPVDSPTSSEKKRKTHPSNALCVSIDGVPTVFTAKAHVNWKTGAYVDNQGEQKRLNTPQLESLR